MDFQSLSEYSRHLLTGEKIFLRATREEDLPVLARWWNTPEIRLGNRALWVETPPEHLHGQFAAWSKNEGSGGFAYSIEAEGHLVGHISTWGLAPPLLNAEIGIIIGSEFQNKGYGREAMRLAMALLFDEMNAHKITLRVYSFNARAIKLYESLGFRHEGTVRHSSYHGGRYYDSYLMGILREEYENERQK